jgi:hypothetical protein
MDTVTPNRRPRPQLVGGWQRPRLSRGHESYVLVAPTTDGGRALRRSDDRALPPTVLYLTAQQWAAFVASVKEGNFD